MRKTAGIIAAATLAGGLAAAAPAMADSGPIPVTVSASIDQTLTVAGISPTVAFGAIAVGKTATIPGAEKYTVTSPTGYTVSATANNDGLRDPGGNVKIRNANLAVNTVNFPNPPLTGASLVLHTSAAGGAASYSDDWSATVPTTPPPGGYGNPGDNLSEDFTYAAISS